MVAYAWGVGNIGDAAITPGLLNVLRRHFPHCSMTVLAEGEKAPVCAYLRKDFPDCEVRQSPFGKPYREALAKAKEDFGGKLPPLQDGNVDYVFQAFAQTVVDSLKRNDPEMITALAETKFVVYNSGMVLVYGNGTLAGNDFWGYTVKRSLPLLAAWKLKVPYGVYAHSFDSFGQSPGLPYFRRLLGDAFFVFCRETSSLRYIEGLGIKPAVLRFVPDSTVSFTGRNDRWAKVFMDEHGLESKQFAVFIPRTWLGCGVVKRIVGEQRSRAHVAKLRDLIQWWVRETGMKAVIAVEVASEQPHAKALLYDPLPEDVKQHCVVMGKFWTAEQAASLYRHTRILVTMELHSFLMAVSEGTPAVVATFKESGRKIQMPEDFKLGDFMFDIDSAPTCEIERAISRIHRNYAKKTNRLRTRVIPYLRTIERQAMQAVVDVLETSGGTR